MLSSSLTLLVMHPVFLATFCSLYFVSLILDVFISLSLLIVFFCPYVLDMNTEFIGIFLHFWDDSEKQPNWERLSYLWQMWFLTWLLFDLTYILSTSSLLPPPFSILQPWLCVSCLVWLCINHLLLLWLDFATPDYLPDYDLDFVSVSWFDFVSLTSFPQRLDGLFQLYGLPICLVWPCFFNISTKLERQSPYIPLNLWQCVPAMTFRPTQCATVCEENDIKGTFQPLYFLYPPS